MSSTAPVPFSLKASDDGGGGKKKVDAQTLVLKPNEPTNNEKRINVTFDLYDAAEKKVHHDETVRRKHIEELRQDLENLQPIAGASDVSEREREKLKTQIARDENEWEKIITSEINLDTIKQILLTYEEIRKQYDEKLSKGQDDEESRDKLKQQTKSWLSQNEMK